ncbi:MAG: SigE family RNA polymerase sigma factor [Actinomycetota bacterium]|nr:SigE family RNA polymerase sigma factor [Actinomycetota bacterium]
MDRDEDYAAYVNARWAALVRAAAMLGCSPQDAEDLAQATLVRCYVSWAKVVGAEDRDAYVYRMLVNTQNTSRRRRWWSERPTADLAHEAEAGDDFDRSDQTDSLRRALAQLGSESRAVVVLRYYADLTEHQTADVLGIPVGTVKSRLSRALAQLATDPHLSDLPEGTTS